MPKKKLDKYSIACKIIEFAEKKEEITVYNMVKKLRESKLNIEEETVRRILKELEKFGILRFKEISISKTKKEKKIYTLVLPSEISKDIIRIIYSSRSFLQEIVTKVFSLIIVLVKNQNCSVIGLTEGCEFEESILNNVLSLIVETYKPDFLIVFFRSNIQEKNPYKFTTIIISPYGVFPDITESKEEYATDKVKNKIYNLMGNIKFPQK